MARQFYLDCGNATGLASDGNDGMSTTTPWLTPAGANADHALNPVGYGKIAGDILNVSGTGRGQLKFPYMITDPSVTGGGRRQWSGMPQAIIRGDTNIPSYAAGWSCPAVGIFEYTIPAHTTDYWNSGGNDLTLMEGIVAVVINWDVNLDVATPTNYPSKRRLGHMTMAPYSLCRRTDIANGRWRWLPHADITVAPETINAVTGAGTVDATQTKGGGGLVRIRLDEYTAGSTAASLAAFQAASLQIGYVLGNRNGIEVGAPTYDPYPTAGDYSLVGTVYNDVTDGIWVYLFSDGGYRQNGGAHGDDMSGYGAGNALGGDSIGYGIRPSNHYGGTIKNCKTIDCGYHGIMYVGNSTCKNNTIQDCEIWGGGINPVDGNSSGMFYCGDSTAAPFDQLDNHITGCVMRRCKIYKYTLLGGTYADSPYPGRPIPYPIVGDAGGTVGDVFCLSFALIAHTNATSANHIRDIQVEDTYVYDSGTNNSAIISGYTINIDTTVTTTIPHRLLTGDKPAIAGTTGTPNINGTRPVTVLSATTFKFTTAVDTTGGGVSSAGTLTLDAGCVGGALSGGNQSETPGDEKVWTSYPVRFVRCVVLKGTTNTCASNHYTAFVNCRLHMDRMGQMGNATGGGAGVPNLGGNYQNGGLWKQLFVGCEIVALFGNTTSGSFVYGFGGYYTDASNNGKILLINNSMYGLTQSGDASTFTGWFSAIGGIVGHEVYYLRGNIIGYDAAAANKWLVVNNIVDWGATEMNAADNLYFNQFAARWVRKNAGTADFTTSALFLNASTGIDKAGIDNLTVNAFADITGASLEPTATIKALKKRLAIHTSVGVNGKQYSGLYGAWQSGGGGGRAHRLGGARAPRVNRV